MSSPRRRSKKRKNPAEAGLFRMNKIQLEDLKSV
nr:MAG TPA: hypothetical protein [Caudoviricetes sp.]